MEVPDDSTSVARHFSDLLADVSDARPARINSVKRSFEEGFVVACEIAAKWPVRDLASDRPWCLHSREGGAHANFETRAGDQSLEARQGARILFVRDGLDESPVC